MTIQWHLTTGPSVDILQISGFLGDDAVARFTGAVGWALARGEHTLLLDCTRLNGWSHAGEQAVANAAHALADQSRDLVLVAPPALIGTLPAYTHLADALDHHQTIREQDDREPADAWHSAHWDDPTS